SSVSGRSSSRSSGAKYPSSARLRGTGIWINWMGRLKQELDVGRHVIGELDQNRPECLEHLLLVLPIGIGFIQLQPGEDRGGDVERDGKLIVRNHCREPIDLALHRVIIDRVERAVQVLLHE